MQMQGIILYGGSFNPLHIGHMRLAIETLSRMRMLAEALQFIPSARPPHKTGTPMLPFWLRTAMIRISISGLPGMSCSEIEAERSGLSYTWETVSLLKNSTPDTRFFFLIGSQDYLLLHEWNRGLELPELCDLIIVPRGNFDRDAFVKQTRQYWPAIADISDEPPDNECSAAMCCIALSRGSHIYWLPLPCLDISSSYIRRLWLCGRNLKYLVPAPVGTLLDAERRIVRECWQENGKSCSM